MITSKNIVLSSVLAFTLLGLSGCSVKSQKLTLPEVAEKSKQDLLLLKKAPEAIEKPISIDEAITRAIKYNKDYKVKALESEFESKQLDISNSAMWPSLNASGGITKRNNELGSSSRSLITGSQSLEESTSTDKELRTSDVKISWNALDFGLSYIRAKQQADKYLIAQERSRKISNQIQQEVRESYWKAVSAQNLLDQIDPVIADVQKSLNESKQLEQAKLGNMMETLTYRRELLDVLLSLQSLKKDLLTAKPKLAVLMGMAPGTTFELSDKIDGSMITKLQVNMENLEKRAFENRPELMESRYQSRISLSETKASMLSFLPGVSFDAGYSYSSNSYTTNNSWLDYGVHVNMNLFKVFSVGDMIDRSKVGEEIAAQQQLAVGMAVLTQVYLADIRYNEAMEGWKSADEYYDVTKKISDITDKQNVNSIGSKQHVARERLSQLLANVKRDMAFAEVQNSYGNLFVSVGLEQNRVNTKMLEGK
jgi:outer membrane protein TolC